MQLFNTLTRQMEEFKPINPPRVTFYHCGPTVYWIQHIGNLRGMTMADLIRRSLVYFDYEVDFVRNYTDVGHLTSDADSGEDKMEKAAKREQLSPERIADKYIKIFETDTTRLNILPPTHTPRASQHIDGMIAMTKTLLENHQAYVTPLAIYFDVSRFPDYNRLNRQKLDLNRPGAGKGTVEDPQKKHATDFALWFFKVGEHADALQTWPSPWGVGFPGWHIECSVMAKELLGETIDIHMGGVEHVAIHHTNEIAQSESANHKPFVHYWLHNEHLTLKTGKMSKSQGTGLALSSLIDQGYDPLDLRYFFLTAHYRTRQEFSLEALNNAKISYQKLRDAVIALKKQTQRTSLSREKLTQLESYQRQFTQALANDFQIPQALAVTWEMVKSNVPSADKLELLYEFDRVLGLKLDAASEAQVPETITALARQRQQARQNGDFAQADALRRQIEKNGYLVEDQPDGCQIKPKR
ncbi:cysteine--tRNA ligase [Patescibacteria group bacterium]|nr:cysteine--tRNA ligase [Patescibacteria group bacterium]MCL5091812.1 cysteine--tRNA ligase [Patescibacteria group bacterium]